MYWACYRNIYSILSFFLQQSIFFWFVDSKSLVQHTNNCIMIMIYYPIVQLVEVQAILDRPTMRTFLCLIAGDFSLQIIQNINHEFFLKKF